VKHEQDSNRVAVCYIENDKGQLLMGKRNDSKKWTNPGGHIEKGEDPYSGAIREMKEETGLDVSDIELKGVKWIPKLKLLLYLFVIKCEHYKCDASNDPDEECDDWEFKDIMDIVDELDVPLDRNIVVRYHLREFDI